MEKKILHITNNDYDGAGKAVLRLNNALNELGYKSKLLVLYKKTSTKNTFSVSSGKSLGEVIKHLLSNKVINKRKIYFDLFFLLKAKIISLKNQLKYNPKNLFNFNNHVFSFKNLVPFIKEVDIVVFHSIQDVLNVSDINKIHTLYKKKIVMHPLDMEMITGGYHFSYDCNCFKTGICNSEHHNLKSLSTYNYKKKLQTLKEIPCIWVASNKYVLKRILSSKIYSKKRHSIHLIYFGMEKDRYRFYNKNYARSNLKLDLNKKILLFGCSNFNDLRKGASIINKIINKLQSSEIDLKKILLLTYGDKRDFNVKNKNIEWVHLGNVNSSKKMNMIYRASDIMLNPSIDDLGPTTVQEAFLNDLYIISFDLGLAQDLILNGYNGRIIKNFSTDNFYNEVYKKLKSIKINKINSLNKKKIQNIKRLCSKDSEAKLYISEIINVK